MTINASPTKRLDQHYDGKISQLREFGYVDLVARSINDSGTIAGIVDNVVGRDFEQGFVWTKNAKSSYDGVSAQSH